MALADQENGALGGHPKLVRDPDELIDAASATIASGKGSVPSLITNGGRNPDYDHTMRMCGISTEEFITRLNAKLQQIIDTTGNQILAALDAAKYKPNELSFLYGLVIDKMCVLSGRQATRGDVNVQINNFAAGPQSRADVLAQLRGIRKKDGFHVSEPIALDSHKP